jgi:DNA (cytosine-5)-methyltransferase 1
VGLLAEGGHGIRYASLCAGGGGLDLGVKLALPGARCVLYVEREYAACAVLVARMREGSLDEAPVWSDAKTFDGRPWAGTVDLLVAGIPCQGNSLAGRRQMERDPRDLWPDARRLLRELGCRHFLLENVAGFLVPGGGMSAPAARVLGELAEGGWDAEWLRLPAAAVGAPHRRERFFLLAERKENVCGVGQADAADIRCERLRSERGGAGEGEGEGRLRQPPGEGLPVHRLDARRRDLADAGRAGLPGRDGGEPRGVGREAEAAEARLPEPQRQRLRDAAGDGGAPVEHALGVDDRPRDGAPDGGEGPAPGAEGGARPGGGGLADAAARRDGRQPEGGGEGAGGAGDLSLWPPGPGDRDAWRRVLSRRPHLAPAVAQEEAESALRELADGLASPLGYAGSDPGRGGDDAGVGGADEGVAVVAVLPRADALRLLGNGVVPAQAALALLILAGRLEEP